MAARRHIAPPVQGRSVQAPGMLRHGSFPATAVGHRLLESVPRPELLEDKIAVQAEEIEQLSGDNRRLASSHVSLRQDLVASQQEIPRLKAHIRSIQTESDIQIRVLLDKIARMEANIIAGENVKKDLQEAHIEAQNLVKSMQELTAKVQLASQELQKARLDVQSLPDLNAELDSLRQEHQRLRSMFEYEKGLNIEKVEQMKAREKDLIGMAREVELLHTAVMKAEMRAHAAQNSHSGGYMNPNPSYPPHVQSGSIYVDAYGKPLVQAGVAPTGEGMIPYVQQVGVVSTGEGMIRYGSDNGVAAAGGVGGTTAPGTSVGAVWGGPPYDPSLARR